jgi:hypothetical protein
MGSVKRVLTLGAAGVVATIAATLGVAQSSDVSTGTATPTEQLLAGRFDVYLGAYVVSSKINGSLRGTIQNETGIDFSQVFGTDANQTRFRAGALWRITQRQGLRLSYFGNDVTRTRDITREITWGDNTYQAGAQVTAETKFQIYELGYEFSFLATRDYKVSATAGVHVEDFTLRLAGNATITNPDGTTQMVNGATQSNSVTAPLPVLGLRGDWAATDHLYLDASLQVFKINYQGIDGNWSDLWLGATWMFTNHFGIGAAFDRWATHTDLNKGAFTGRLNLGYQGGLIFLRASF